MSQERNRCLPDWYLANFRNPQLGIVWCYERGLSEVKQLPVSEISLLTSLEDRDGSTSGAAGASKLIAEKPLVEGERSGLCEFLAQRWLKAWLSQQPVGKEHIGTAESLPHHPNVGALVEMIMKMKWSVRTTDETLLVTSDSPVILNNPSVTLGFGPPTPWAYEVIFPLSAERLLIATWDMHAGEGLMSARVVRQINKLISSTAAMYVYAPVQIPAIAIYLLSPRQNLIAARQSRR
jgi:hypothetical protein